MLKLRTMERGAHALGPGITAAGDVRVTRLGRYLRRTKLDELPQLWNVLRGEMLLVGPRPEDPRYVDWSDPLHRLVFGSRPGITGPTALEYGDEEALLAQESKGSLEILDDIYRQRVLPRKLALDAEYLRTRSWRGDIAILRRTVGHLLRPSRRHPKASPRS
jgi:lipopolysaccharide/colanic/teichoic acid biosynthesis glycosyltransferase